MSNWEPRANLETALDHTARLLEHAEMETDLVKMAEYRALGEAWNAYSATLIEMGRVLRDE